MPRLLGNPGAHTGGHKCYNCMSFVCLVSSMECTLDVGGIKNVLWGYTYPRSGISTAWGWNPTTSQFGKSILTDGQKHTHTHKGGMWGSFTYDIAPPLNQSDNKFLGTPVQPIHLIEALTLLYLCIRLLAPLWINCTVCKDFYDSIRYLFTII